MTNCPLPYSCTNKHFSFRIWVVVVVICPSLRPRVISLYVLFPRVNSLTALCPAGVWKSFNSESLIALATWDILWMSGIQQQDS